MADYTLTAASVLSSLAGFSQLTAGATITAGQPIAKDTNGKAQLCQANAGATYPGFVGLAVNGGVSGQPINYVPSTTPDPTFTHGLATVAAGAIIAVSAANPGELAPASDIATGSTMIIVGVAISATQMYLKPLITGAVHA